MIIDFKCLTQYWDKSARDDAAIQQRRQEQQAFLQDNKVTQTLELTPDLTLHIHSSTPYTAQRIEQGWVIEHVLFYHARNGHICLRQHDGTFIQHDLTQSALHYRIDNRQRIEDATGIYWRYEEQLIALQLQDWPVTGQTVQYSSALS